MESDLPYANIQLLTDSDSLSNDLVSLKSKDLNVNIILIKDFGNKGFQK